MRITYPLKPGDIVKGTMTGRVRIFLRVEPEAVYYMQVDNGVVDFDCSTHDVSGLLDHWIACGWELM
jgi:hypothetical protein